MSSCSLPRWDSLPVSFLLVSLTWAVNHYIIVCVFQLVPACSSYCSLSSLYLSRYCRQLIVHQYFHHVTCTFVLFPFLRFVHQSLSFSSFCYTFQFSMFRFSLSSCICLTMLSFFLESWCKKEYSCLLPVWLSVLLPTFHRASLV